jgi:hypothetical protein
VAAAAAAVARTEASSDGVDHQGGISPPLLSRESYINETEMILEAYKKLAMGVQLPAASMSRSPTTSPKTPNPSAGGGPVGGLMGGNSSMAVSDDHPEPRGHFARSTWDAGAGAGPDPATWKSPLKAAFNPVSSSSVDTTGATNTQTPPSPALGAGAGRGGSGGEAVSSAAWMTTDSQSEDPSVSRSQMSRMMTGRVAELQPNPEVQFELDWET